MSKKDEALKLALEALVDARVRPPHKQDSSKYEHAITAIREALAEQPAQQGCMRCNTPKKCALYGCSPLTWPAEQPAQQQEPVVWMYQNKSTHEVSFQKHMRSFVDHGAWYEVPLYSEPLANQEKTSGSPKPAKPEALRLAELFEVAANAAPEGDEGWLKTAAELRRMHDLLGKANALCRIRAEEIERLKAQPAQEPVAWMWKDGTITSDPDRADGTWMPLYTTPPASKPWVGLTDEERGQVYASWRFNGSGSSNLELCQAIEAKLKEKNA